MTKWLFHDRMAAQLSLFMRYSLIAYQTEQLLPKEFFDSMPSLESDEMTTQAILGYLGLTQAISGYLKLSWAISLYLRISRGISGYLGLSQVVLGCQFSKSLYCLLFWNFSIPLFFFFFFFYHERVLEELSLLKKKKKKRK